MLSGRLQKGEQVSATIEKKRAVWDWIDDNRPELWDRPLAPDDPQLTDDLLQTLADVANAVSKTPWTTPEVVRSWLSDTRTHSPYVDEIAVERALDFDWQVIDNLTRLERRVLVDRLQAMDDPFSEHHALDFVFDMYKSIGAERVKAEFPRRQRYLEGSLQQRATLTKALWRARRAALVSEAA